MLAPRMSLTQDFSATWQQSYSTRDSKLGQAAKTISRRSEVEKASHHLASPASSKMTGNHLDIGRPKQVQPIFDRRSQKHPSPIRTPVIRDALLAHRLQRHQHRGIYKEGRA